jgi:hypothetical protein
VEVKLQVVLQDAGGVGVQGHDSVLHEPLVRLAAVGVV